MNEMIGLQILLMIRYGNILRDNDNVTQYIAIS